MPSNKSAVLAASAAEHAVYAPAHHVSSLRSTRLLIHQWDEWLPSGSPPQLPSPPTSSTRPVPPPPSRPSLRSASSSFGGKSVFEEGDAGDAFFILVSRAVVVRKGDLVLATLKAEATTQRS